MMKQFETQIMSERASDWNQETISADKGRGSDQLARWRRRLGEGAERTIREVRRHMLAIMHEDREYDQWCSDCLTCRPRPTSQGQP